MEISDSEPPGNLQRKSSMIDDVSTNSFLPLHHYIPKTQENHFFYKNGLSKIIPRLTVKVHSQIDECYELWEKFTCKKSLFDLWDFRKAWYEGYEYRPFFYTIYERQKPLAVLPLWYNGYRKKYQWFGSDWMEDNNFFVKDEKFIDVLFQIAPSPLLLNAIEVKNNWGQKNIFPNLKTDDPKNLKDLTGILSIDELLSTFEKKDRYNLRSDYAQIEAMNPRVAITEGKDFEKMDMMIKMNIERFSKDPEDESDFVDKERRRTYRQMLDNAGSYKAKFIEVYIQNHLAAIDFIVTYKDRYYTMKGSNDINRFSGIGNYMVYIEFEDALKEGFSTVDCLQMDNGWKHRYFDQKELFLLEK